MKAPTELSNQRNEFKDLYREMPLRYRILTKVLLKLPNPSIPFFVLRRVPLLEGIFHGLALPILVYLFGVLSLWLMVSSTMAVGFPLNVIIVLVPPTIVFAISVRIQLEKAINWWRTVFGSPVEWDSSKSIEELIELFEKQQNKAKK